MSFSALRGRKKKKNLWGLKYIVRISKGHSHTVTAHYRKDLTSLKFPHAVNLPSLHKQVKHQLDSGFCQNNFSFLWFIWLGPVSYKVFLCCLTCGSVPCCISSFIRIASLTCSRSWFFFQFQILIKPMKIKLWMTIASLCYGGNEDHHIWFL